MSGLEHVISIPGAISGVVREPVKFKIYLNNALAFWNALNNAVTFRERFP